MILLCIRNGFSMKYIRIIYSKNGLENILLWNILKSILL